MAAQRTIKNIYLQFLSEEGKESPKRHDTRATETNQSVEKTQLERTTYAEFIFSENYEEILHNYMHLTLTVLLTRSVGGRQWQ